jgi:hypothetical protein
MTLWHIAAIGIPLLFVPLCIAMSDAVGALRAAKIRRRSSFVEPHSYGELHRAEDFEILVPIYGSLRYLENVAYLRRYGSKVLLCTTTQESPEFDRDLDDLANMHGFRVFRGDVARAVGRGRRATGGTVRDRLIRDALGEVRSEYVVCLDADTTTTRPLRELIMAMMSRGLDLASIRLVPSNSGSVLARLQRHEYRLAMQLRHVLPWMVSGACHAGRTTALHDAMNRHSLFFQGNDVELGLLAEALGYRVGHVPFEVPTTVPETVGRWLDQRLAWSGGEVRLFLANPQIALRHPFVWGYGALLVIALSPIRWAEVTHPGPPLVAVGALYLGFCLYLHRGHWDRYVVLLPLYTAFSSLVLAPLGILSYASMAWRDRNLGRICVRRRLAGVPVAGERTPATPVLHPDAA